MKLNLAIPAVLASRSNGRTYESVGLHPEQIMVLHFEPASPDSVPEMVTA
ncbi:hypothetical protein [Nostoc sp.]